MRELERSAATSSRDTQLVRRVYGFEPVEILSGDQAYRFVGSVSPDDGVRRGLWEVAVRDAEGAESTHRLGAPGDELYDLTVVSDGAGALLLYFAQTRRRGVGGGRTGSLMLLAGETQVFARDVPVHWGELPLRLERLETGWLMVAPERGRALAVWRVAEDGTLVDSVPLDTEAAAVAVGEGHGSIGVARAGEAWATSVLFSSGVDGRMSEPIEIDVDRGPAAWLRPVHVIAAPDGWWVVIDASWRDVHWSAAPPQWRFVHLDPSGAPTGHAHVRWDGWGTELESLRAEGSALHGVYVARSGRFAQPAVTRTAFVVEPRGACEPEPLTRCSPRVWGRDPLRAWPPPRGWRAISDRETGPSLVRLDASGERLWARTPAWGVLAREPATLAGRSYLLVRGHQERARLVVLDDRTGEQLEVVDLDVDRVEVGCLAARREGVLVGLATHLGLHIFQLSAGAPARVERRHAIEGSFSECTIAVMPDRVVVGTMRVAVQSSAGPFGSVEMHVLSRDARDARETLVPPEPRGAGVRMLVDEQGVAIVWHDPSGWHRTLWRLDPEGRAIGAPRHLATLYGLQATALISTELGPGLAWSTWNEEGFVPFCHADELGEPPRDAGFRGAVISVPTSSPPR